MDQEGSTLERCRFLPNLSINPLLSQYNGQRTKLAEFEKLTLKFTWRKPARPAASTSLEASFLGPTGILLSTLFLLVYTLILLQYLLQQLPKKRRSE